MMDDPREELSDAEQRAFAALSRERAPGAELEERTVAMLRRQGLLPTPITINRGQGGKGPRVWWISGAVAAALAIFASGLAVGQYLGARNAALVVNASNQSAAQLAAHMQRAGALYKTALIALSQMPDSGNPAVRDSVRRVALTVLGEAAQEAALFAPDDPVATAVLRGLNQRSRNDQPIGPSRSVVWY
jgi:hypothetical protein